MDKTELENLQRAVTRQYRAVQRIDDKLAHCFNPVVRTALYDDLGQALKDYNQVRADYHQALMEANK